MQQTYEIFQIALKDLTHKKKGRTGPEGLPITGHKGLNSRYEGPWLLKKTKD
jgi:hypothetical protein